MGNKIDINLCKSAKAKKQCHSLPFSVLRMKNDQCKHFKCGFTPDSNPKMGKKGGNKIGIYEITDVAYLRFLRVWTVQCILSLALPLTASQKGNKIDMYLCKMQC